MSAIRSSDECPNNLDLSAHHKPVSELFRSQLDANPESFQLSNQQVRAFEELGFVSGIRALSDEQVSRLCSELTELTRTDHPGFELWHEFHSNESTDPGSVLFHALGAWRLAPGFHDLLYNPAILVPASQLLNGPVRFWHDQLFCKPAKHGGVVAWHQDYSYWTRTRPLSHLTCWIALDDATIENGCLQYIPGSHKWDLLPITGLAGDMDAIQEVLNEEQFEALQNPTPIELRKGEITFHHPLLVHGSFQNRSTTPRRGAVLNLVRDGVKSDSNSELLKGIPPIGKGEPLGGQFFPLLYPEITC